MNKKNLVICTFLVLISALTIYSLIYSENIEGYIIEYDDYLRYVNLGNDVMVDIGENFDEVSYIDGKSNGISLKNNYSTVDIQYFSINDFKFKKINFTNNTYNNSYNNNYNNTLNIENNKNMALLNESKYNINNITVYSQTFKSGDNIIQSWVFQEGKFGYLIITNTSSKTYNSEKYKLIVDDIKNIISSLNTIEYG